jgi:hypothetical protein
MFSFMEGKNEIIFVVLSLVQLVERLHFIYKNHNLNFKYPIYLL